MYRVLRTRQLIKRYEIDKQKRRKFDLLIINELSHVNSSLESLNCLECKFFNFPPLTFNSIDIQARW